MLSLFLCYSAGRGLSWWERCTITRQSCLPLHQSPLLTAWQAGIHFTIVSLGSDLWEGNWSKMPESTQRELLLILVCQTSHQCLCRDMNGSSAVYSNLWALETVVLLGRSCIHKSESSGFSGKIIVRSLTTPLCNSSILFTWTKWMVSLSFNMMTICIHVLWIRGVLKVIYFPPTGHLCTWATCSTLSPWYTVWPLSVRRERSKVTSGLQYKPSWVSLWSLWNKNLAYQMKSLFCVLCVEFSVTETPREQPHASMFYFLCHSLRSDAYIWHICTSVYSCYVLHFHVWFSQRKKTHQITHLALGSLGMPRLPSMIPNTSPRSEKFQYTFYTMFLLLVWNKKIKASVFFCCRNDIQCMVQI